MDGNRAGEREDERRIQAHRWSLARANAHALCALPHACSLARVDRMARFLLEPGEAGHSPQAASPWSGSGAGPCRRADPHGLRRIVLESEKGNPGTSALLGGSGALGGPAPHRGETRRARGHIEEALMFNALEDFRERFVRRPRPSDRASDPGDRTKRAPPQRVEHGRRPAARRRASLLASPSKPMWCR